MKLIHPNYPSFIKEIRHQLSISQEDLARELGVSFATVNRRENGQTKPSRLARVQLDAFCERMQAAVISAHFQCHSLHSIHNAIF
jgi:transcriptional regulator with XRE-family HTH domain